MASEGDPKDFQVIGMAANPIVGRVWQLAEPLCLSEGMELVHVEYQREPSGRILRLYLDKPGGVTLDDCVGISRQLGDILDVGLDTEQPYRMEVSSPGIERPLGKLSDFERYKGCRAKVRIAQAVNGRKNFSGILDGTSGQTVRLMVDDRPISFELADILKAHLTHYNGEDTC